MKATIEKIELRYSSKEKTIINRILQNPEVKGTGVAPDKATLRELRVLRRAVGDGLEEMEWDTSDRMTLLRLRNDLRQTLDGIEMIEDTDERA